MARDLCFQRTQPVFASSRYFRESQIANLVFKSPGLVPRCHWSLDVSQNQTQVFSGRSHLHFHKEFFKDNEEFPVKNTKAYKEMMRISRNNKQQKEAYKDIIIGIIRLDYKYMLITFKEILK